MKMEKRSIFFHWLLILIVNSFQIMTVSSQNYSADIVTAPIKVDIGVVLASDSIVGKMGLSCLSMALSDFYASHGDYRTRIVLQARDSKGADVVGAASAALDLIKNSKVQAIIGPQYSTQADFVINLGEKSQVPIITFSATSPSHSPLQHHYFFRATQNAASQVEAISAIIKHYKWREAVPIYVDDEYGRGFIPFLADALRQIDTRTPYKSVLSPAATEDQISSELYKMMAMQTRVFIVHMLPTLASRVFAKADEIGMMEEGYVWIVTNVIGNLLSTLNSSLLNSMEGVLGIKTYFRNSKFLEELNIRWKRKFYAEHPEELNAVKELSVYGLWAYDTAVALAMAVDAAAGQAQLDVSYFEREDSHVSKNRTDLESLGVSRFGPRLAQALSGVQFKGVAGDFSLKNGQLPTSTLEIVNVVGQAKRVIGFWNPEHGQLTKKLNFKKRDNDSEVNLGTVIWPGDPRQVPKGWDVPIKGKTLKIGVPVKEGFPEFVKIVRDPNTKAVIEVKGYCIEVFDAVMQQMPYHVPYKYFPYELSDGQPAGTYDDLIKQVSNQKYDAVVGDVTIVANRSLLVDFTLPYTESGVTMMVPIRDDKSKNAWLFLKPLTWELWMTSACFFVFIGFVVWVLEHRVNEDFRGPPSNQIGIILWFSFSTMVFAQKEKVVSNLARFVVIVWFFVVLVLTQSYTASLTSMLTVEKLQPTITDMNELLKKGYNVGYLENSFVYDLLKEMKFDEGKLKKYTSPQDLEEAFSRDSSEGGIAAAFDEIPYARIFLSTRSSKFTMIGPIHKTAGFGFVFPRNSPLVSDVSRAVLNVTQGEKMIEIENHWFNYKQKASQDNTNSASIAFKSIGLDSFWGLFLIVGIAALSVFLFYGATFLSTHKHIFTEFSPETRSVWRKLTELSRQFDSRDSKSHTFRKEKDRRSSMIVGNSGECGSTPCNGCCPMTSPMSYSVHSEFPLFTPQQGTPSWGEDRDKTSSNDNAAGLEIWSNIQLHGEHDDDEDGDRPTIHVS